MEIKNKNIYQYLDQDEEILYVSEKQRWRFYFNIPVFILLSISAMSVFIYMCNIPNNRNMLFMLIFVLLLFSLCFTYKLISDYYFAEIIITNKKMILSKFNKFTPIEFKQIRYINASSRGFSGTFLSIVLNSRKFYFINFVKFSNLLLKLKQAYPDYGKCEKRLCDEYSQATPFLAIGLLCFTIIMIILMLIFNSFKH